MNVTSWGVRASRAWVAVVFAGCGQAKPVPVATPPTPAPISVPSPTRVGGEADAGAAETPQSASSELDAGADHGLEEGAVDAANERAQITACPSGMILVDTNYCPRIERKCIDEEYSPQNKITICHKYATSQRCLGEQERRRFCIDEYEYPNKKGAHPPWMVSWYDAQATCGSLGKRLCYEGEWVSACEGPDKTPFPYGYARDNTKCNIDNQWIKPSLPEVYSKDAIVALEELSRLDQSVASGALPECVSGFGVHDLTGNFDEWVTADSRHDDKSEWAALKGGAWGHVRNACRPVTTSHPPDFTYYFIAFRCCKDAAGGESHPPRDAGVPEVEAGDRAPLPTPIYPTGPSSTKVAREHWPRPTKPAR